MGVFNKRMKILDKNKVDFKLMKELIIELKILADKGKQIENYLTTIKDPRSNFDERFVNNLTERSKSLKEQYLKSQETISKIKGMLKAALI